MVAYLEQFVAVAPFELKIRGTGFGWIGGHGQYMVRQAESLGAACVGQGACLVCHAAVHRHHIGGCHVAICLPISQGMGAHPVGDQLARDAQFLQRGGRQARTLQVRPGLRDQDTDLLAGIAGFDQAHQERMLGETRGQHTIPVH
ncbi:hypothetical protein SDC9_174848 [bioreactor metagenome]|uniref:Uncharacterized protein n=1 Tax=bioreactor metagenome TaxID=1076179 RepID=A0A645GL21_9ZZZZ